jgi:hypothetical protein
MNMFMIRPTLEGGRVNNRYVAALAGTVAGVFAGWAALVLLQADAPGVAWERLLIPLFILAAPGALVLGLPFAAALEDYRDGDASRDQVLAWGAVCGIPVGLLNQLLMLLWALGWRPLLMDGFAMQVGTWLPGLAGGAAFGLACAIVLTCGEEP